MVSLAKPPFVPRQWFPPHNVPLANFPGHHRQALADIKTMAHDIDLVVEFRDSRAPLSSINPVFQQVLPGIPRLVLYAKRDVTLLKQTHLLSLHPDGLFEIVETEKRKHANRTLRYMRELALKQVPRPPLGFRVLMVGLPNSGKSTFINKMREVVFGKHRAKVARTGNTPGVTRTISEAILVSVDPKIYVYDSPGISVPQALDWEQMLKLYLIGAVPKGNIDPLVAADYLLYQMNRFYPMGGRYPTVPTNDIEKVLWSVANTNRQRPRRDEWDSRATAAQWVNRFACGGIGKIQLDDLSDLHLREILPKIQEQKLDLSTLPRGRSPFGSLQY